ncbi:C2H2 zinc finger transcription factor [Lithospermum erythrorhizon]|uniref:C2H2 zinc finger transcription factor n=1 Tax=Lithospermum erythrorhizon TaxID=34254 RepID=A0AAV3Q241_LITER
MEFQESATFFMDQYQENQESKFLCKLCNEKYPCGKSVGGHMRSHVLAANPAESEEQVEPNMKKLSSLLNWGAKFPKKEENFEEFGVQSSQGNYGLRENPKKTWRAVDQNFHMPQEKVCKQCGKVFQSLKALCGHMACHSEKERGGGNKDDSSWTSESNNSDTETEERRKLRSKSRSSKRYKRLSIKSSSYSLADTNASSSVSEIDEIAQEEVAVCLMMLSRDSISKCGGLNSVVESSDNNSVVLETKFLSSTEMRSIKEGLIMEKIGNMKLKKNDSSDMVQLENSDSEYFLGDAPKGESEVSVDEIRRNAAYWECANSAKFRGYGTVLGKESTKENVFGNGGMALNLEKKCSKKRKKADNIWEENDDGLVDESYKNIKNGSSDKRSKYECLNCKKSFKSYQALGGHRPCHKRINANAQSKFENGENSLDENNVANHQPSGNKKGKSEKKVGKSKKQKGHLCPFCPRVFKSGQALGGHKRSHFLGGGGGNVEIRSQQSPEINKPEVHDLFDLNLPAPVEDEDDDGNVQFPSW